MNRQEFTKPVRFQIIQRARVGSTTFRCEREGCGAIVMGFEINHKNMDALKDGFGSNKRVPLTANDGELLCKPCHREETKRQMASLAKAKRIEARHVGAHEPRVKIRSRGWSFAKKGRAHADRASLKPKDLFK